MAPKKARKRPPAKTGRKEFQPTADQRTMVRVLTAIGMPYLSMAHVIRISVNTLQKHFRNELDFGRADVVAEVTMARYQAAMNGNAGAQTKLLEQAGAGPLPIETKEAAPPPPKEPKPPKLGKKEQRKVDAAAAVVADDDWSKLLPH